MLVASPALSKYEETFCKKDGSGNYALVEAKYLILLKRLELTFEIIKKRFVCKVKKYKYFKQL